MWTISTQNWVLTIIVISFRVRSFDRHLLWFETLEVIRIRIIRKRHVRYTSTNIINIIIDISFFVDMFDTGFRWRWRCTWALIRWRVWWRWRVWCQWRVWWCACYWKKKLNENHDAIRMPKWLLNMPDILWNRFFSVSWCHRKNRLHNSARWSIRLGDKIR